MEVSQAVAEAAAKQEQERQADLLLKWEAYLGTDPLPLPVADDGTDDNIRLNYAKLIVNKGVSWLFGADRGLAFSVADNNKASDTLLELWPMEQRAVALHQLGVNGGVCGHTFVRLMDKTDTNPLPRVVVLDPSNMTVFWDQEDIENVLEYRYQWNAIDPATGDAYVRRQRTINGGTTWRIVDEKSAKDATSFDLLGEETWPRPWSPIFECQNLPAPNEFYGASDLEGDVLALVTAIEFVGGYARKLVRHRGHPLPYIIGEEKDRLENLNVSLGRLLVIPEATASVGQLQSADLGTTMTLYDTLKQALYEVSRVPATAFGTSMSNIAEETVELSFAPAVEKTWDKRLTYGPMLSDLAGRILELGGLSDLLPMPEWTPVVPRSAKSEATALEADLRMGLVSKATASNKRGYDWKVEEAKMREERDANASALGDAFNSGNINFGG